MMKKAVNAINTAIGRWSKKRIINEACWISYVHSSNGYKVTGDDRIIAFWQVDKCAGGTTEIPPAFPLFLNEIPGIPQKGNWTNTFSYLSNCPINRHPQAMIIMKCLISLYIIYYTLLFLRIGCIKMKFYSLRVLPGLTRHLILSWFNVQYEIAGQCPQWHKRILTHGHTIYSL